MDDYSFNIDLIINDLKMWILMKNCYEKQVNADVFDTSNPYYLDMLKTHTNVLKCHRIYISMLTYKCRTNVFIHQLNKLIVFIDECIEWSRNKNIIT